METKTDPWRVLMIKEWVEKKQALAMEMEGQKAIRSLKSMVKLKMCCHVLGMFNCIGQI